MTFEEFDNVLRVIESATEEDLDKIKEMIDNRWNEIKGLCNVCHRGRNCIEHMGG